MGFVRAVFSVEDDGDDLGGVPAAGAAVARAITQQPRLVRECRRGAAAVGVILKGEEAFPGSSLHDWIRRG